MQRPREHGAAWYTKTRLHYPVVRWILKLREAGYKYEITVLEEFTSSGCLNEAEKFHIAYLRSLGMSLLNCTEGGEGISGHHFSDATRAEMSRTRRGRKATPEARENMSAAQKGKKMSPEAVARTAAAHRGKKRSPETCARLSESHRGKTLPAEQRAKISAANRLRVYPRGYKLSPEHVANSAAAHRGLKRSEETKANMRAAQQRRRAAERKIVPKLRFNLLSRVA